MITDKFGIAAATEDELFAVWLFDDDLFRLLHRTEWLMWCKITGVTVLS